MRIESVHHLNVDWLRKNRDRIYFFGLGFIQVKLDESRRVHFYTKELPAFVETPHNHRYDFVSKILAGRFVNNIYSEDEGGAPHILELEACKEGVKPEQKPREVRILPVFSRTYAAGESYFMDHHTLHTVEGMEAITLLTRGGIRKEFAEVTRPVGNDPICPFSQKIPEERLWEIIESMLARTQAAQRKPAD